jgi:ubiquinone biosynthesis protein
VFARHGFQNLAERAKLGQFVLEKIFPAETEKLSTAERLRISFEQLGPTFIKLGQLLATRPDLIPPHFCDEFKKLQDQVPSVPFSEIEVVLRKQYGSQVYEIFSDIEKEPIAAASIAQVHRAHLKDGLEVVLKIQRPGLASVIEEDLDVMYSLAELLNKYVPEVRVYNPVDIVDEFFKNLDLETNFIIEANNIRRFSENFEDDPNVKIPYVYMMLTGEKVLVLEALHGTPLSNRSAVRAANFDLEKIMRVGLRSYLNMVFRDGLFHGDLHAGNIFIMPDQRIGLIDFGVVGRLNRKTQNSIANMLIALSQEDYDRMAYEFVDLAPYSDYVDVDRFARELRDLIAPYYGLTMRNVNLGRILLDSASIASTYKLSTPAELILFFKSMVTVEGLAHDLVQDFDFLKESLAFAGELVKAHYEPEKIKRDLTFLGRDMNAFVSALPRQLKLLVRRIGHPDFSIRLNILHIDELRRAIETSSNILFLGIVIASLVLSSSIILVVDRGPRIAEIPALSLAGYSLAFVFGVLAFINYIRK